MKKTCKKLLEELIMLGLFLQSPILYSAKNKQGIALQTHQQEKNKLINYKIETDSKKNENSYITIEQNKAKIKLYDPKESEKIKRKHEKEFYELCNKIDPTQTISNLVSFYNQLKEKWRNINNNAEKRFKIKFYDEKRKTKGIFLKLGF